jgi:phosphoribosylaminoimidazole carboxylase (NCAIR synthetase)
MIENIKNLLVINLRSDNFEGEYPLIVAKNMGLSVTLLGDKIYPVHHLVAEQWLTETYNIEKSFEIFIDYYKKTNKKFSGVVTFGDRDVELCAKIANYLNLPSNSIETAKITRNKYLMRKKLSKIKNLVPNFCVVHNETEFFTELKKFNQYTFLDDSPH